MRDYLTVFTMGEVEKATAPYLFLNFGDDFMRKFFTVVLASAMIISAAACSNTDSNQNNGGNTPASSVQENSADNRNSEASTGEEGTESTAAVSEQSVFEKIENDDPLTTENEELKPFLDYINEHVYTSDFDKPKKKKATTFYVTNPSDKRQKLTLPGEIKLDDSVTVKLHDSMLSLTESSYLKDSSFNPDKLISGNYLNEDEFNVKSEFADLYKGTGNRVATVYFKNFEKDKTEAKNCTIYELTVTTPTDSEPEIEYMGIKPGDTLEKVVSLIGSPNYEIHFESIHETTCNAFLDYVDFDNKVSLHFNIQIDLSKDTDKAVVYCYTVYGYDLKEWEENH